MLARLQTVIVKYLAYLGVIVGVWAQGVLDKNVDFTALTSAPAIHSLIGSIIPWLIVCLIHFSSTGDPDPVAPNVSTKEKEETPPAPPPVPSRRHDA